VLFFANVWRRTWLLPSVGLALLVLSAILLGLIWPGHRPAVPGQARPEPDKEAPYIARNIEATRAAYDIAGIEVTYVRRGDALTRRGAAGQIESTRPVPARRPELVRQAFEQQQQVRGYYSVADVLDVDRYEIDGTDRASCSACASSTRNGINSDDARTGPTCTPSTPTATA
jgi:uncharacterized membrane protein (UPF0182 family)